MYNFPMLNYAFLNERGGGGGHSSFISYSEKLCIASYTPVKKAVFIKACPCSGQPSSMIYNSPMYSWSASCTIVIFLVTR